MVCFFISGLSFTLIILKFTEYILKLAHTELRITIVEVLKILYRIVFMLHPVNVIHSVHSVFLLYSFTVAPVYAKCENGFDAEAAVL